MDLEKRKAPLAESGKRPAVADAAVRDHKSHRSITIGLPPGEVYAFWRKLGNLPQFMKDLSSVEELSPKQSRWTVTLKSGVTATWTAEITEDRPGVMMAWKSVAPSMIETDGNIWFTEAPAGRGTVVELAMNYHVPGGKLAELAAKITGEDPDTLAMTNLRRLKALLETGEFPTTEGQTSGREGDEPAPTLH